MRKIVNSANILTICLTLALVLTPVFAVAQIQQPDCSGTGICNPQFGGSLTEFILRVINIALAIAGLVAVLFLIIGGFRFITAGGNEAAAESAKKIITNSVIGVIVIILSFVIVRVVTNTLTSTNI